MIKEWWLKDATGKIEKKLEKEIVVTQVLIDFFGGRLYQKTVKTPTTDVGWVSINVEKFKGNKLM